jgi:hypothetical protein
LGFLLDDVTAAYHGQPLVPRPTFFAALPFIINVPSDAGHFWETQLADYVPPNVPSARPESQSRAQLREIHATVPPADIERACQEMNTTIQAVTLLAWSVH